MCGIWGFITAETTRGYSDRRKFIENAAIAGTVRGDDGAGLFIVKHKMEDLETADWCKVATDGYSLVSDKIFQERVGIGARVENYRAVIGHNRAATMGVITIENTHPFQEGPITLVHNGTLTSTYELPQSMHELKKSGQEVEVDSHVITHNLAVATDPADVISKLDGAFVLIWHDARDNSINVVRNDKRPIHFAPAKCENTVLIASEADMLHWLARRNNFTIDGVVFPKPGALLKFKPGSTVPEVREVPLYVPRYWGGGRSRYEDWQSGGWRSSSSYSSASQPDTKVIKALPAPASDALLQYSLEPTDQLKFLPTRINEVHGSKFAVVSGSVTVPGDSPYTGYITGLLYDAIQDAIKKEEVWTVRPIMVRHLEDNTPVLVLKLVSRTWTAVGRSEELTVDKTDQQAMAQRLGSAKMTEYVFGPHREMIPVSEWLRHTADGCVQCGSPLVADEADDIVWVQGQSRPLCPGCVLENCSGVH